MSPTNKTESTTELVYRMLALGKPKEEFDMSLSYAKDITEIKEELQKRLREETTQERIDVIHAVNSIVGTDLTNVLAKTNCPKSMVALAMGQGTALLIAEIGLNNDHQTYLLGPATKQVMTIVVVKPRKKEEKYHAMPMYVDGKTTHENETPWLQKILQSKAQARIYYTLTSTHNTSDQTDEDDSTDPNNITNNNFTTHPNQNLRPQQLTSLANSSTRQEAGRYGTHLKKQVSTPSPEPLCL